MITRRKTDYNGIMKDRIMKLFRRYERVENISNALNISIEDVLLVLIEGKLIIRNPNIK